jgi:hypothetical protein
MVSKASELLPEPLNPVITTSLSRGMLRLIFFRLCSAAPVIWIAFSVLFAIETLRQNFSVLFAIETLRQNFSLPTV